MSDCGKEKWLLKALMEAIGVTSENNSVGDSYNKMDVNLDTAFEKNFKEKFNNRFQEVLEKTNEFSSCGNESSLDSEENEKDKINSRIKASLKEKNVLDENYQSTECEIGVTNYSPESLKMIMTSKSKEFSKGCQLHLDRFNFDTSKPEQCFSNEQGHSFLSNKHLGNYLKKSSKGHGGVQEKLTTMSKQFETSTMQSTFRFCSKFEENSKRQEQKDFEETTRKEYFVKKTFEKGHSRDKDDEELTSDCLFDDESSGLHEPDDIELNASFVFSAEEDKVAKDMNQSEKTSKALDKIVLQTADVSLADLISWDNSQSSSKYFQNADFKGLEENFEEGKGELLKTMGFDHLVVLSNSFSSYSIDYEADESCLEEEMSPVFCADNDVSFLCSTEMAKFRTLVVDDSSSDKGMECMNHHPEEKFMGMPLLNEFNTNNPIEVEYKLCFQNNIVCSTLDANIWGSLQSKCKSKNFSMSFTTSTVEISCSSNSFYYGPEKSISLEVLGLSEPVFDKKCLTSISPFQVPSNKNSKQSCKTWNPYIASKENKCHKNGSLNKKSGDKWSEEKIMECMKENKLGRPNFRKKVKKGNAHKKKKKQVAKSSHSFTNSITNKRNKKPKGKSFLSKKRPDGDVNILGHQLQKIEKREYNDTYSLLREKAQNLKCDKVRNHTRGKSNQNGGSRSSGSNQTHEAGGIRQRSSGGSQGSRAGTQSNGSGGEHPDDHDWGKRYNVSNMKTNDNDGDNEDDDDDDDDRNTKTKKKKVGEQSDHHHKPVPLVFGVASSSGAQPNLPPPVWDHSTIVQRQRKEKAFHEFGGASPHKIPLPLLNIGIIPGAEEDMQGHRRLSAPNLATTSGAAAIAEYLPVPCTAPVTGKGSATALQTGQKHATIDAVQLCEIIGYATNDATVPRELFEKFDTCLTKVMHDLNFDLQESESPQMQTFTASSSIITSTNELCNANAGDKPSLSACDITVRKMGGNISHLPEPGKPPSVGSKVALESPSSSLSCTVCLVVSSLISHLSHDRKQVCMSCAQILNFMTQHARSCVAKRRPKQRITSSDLCYKICKKAGWCTENIICDSTAFRGKIQKYCDKALCKSMKVPASAKEFDVECSFDLGEMESMIGPDALSSGVNSSPSISFCGNPVTLDSGEKISPPSCGKQSSELDSFVSKTHEAAAPSLLPVGQTGTALNNQIPGSTVSNGATAHRNLSRKSSHRSPAIPQSIEEESTVAESGLAQSEGQSVYTDTDIKDLIYKRYGPKGSDPYDTQPTFGDKKGYESMPLGNLHDQAQFMSFGNRAVGVPGIGEVVFGNLKQLRLVARFWEKKREDCERTRTIPPYQHREEGVILSQFKGQFSILRTRYQKHDQWERVAHLGNGMSGKCHLAKDLMTGFKFCCKKVHLLKYSKDEVNLWSELEHPFIVKLYGVLRHGVKIYVFCEFIDGGSLAACIEEQRHLGQRFSHWAAINYFHQLLRVLAYLQSKDILHEDIKADNILLRSGCTSIALTDFGICRRLCDPKELLHKSPQGSPAHWSPEKAASQGHGFPADLWAAVCVLIHMLSGDPPWMRRFMKSATILNFIIFSREPPLEDVPSDVQPMVRDLIACGLVKDAEKRPNAQVLLGHEAFKILENKQPERYYSTLGGLNQALLQSKTNDAEKGPQILFSAEISTGPYQESAGPIDQSAGNEIRNEEAILASEEEIPGVDILASPNGNQELNMATEVKTEQETSDAETENLPKRLNEASSTRIDQQSNVVAALGQSGEKSTSGDRKLQQFPVFDDLLSSFLVPDESKAFYTDDIPDGVEALKHSTFKQQKLEVFVPEVLQEGQIPNLSIFGLNLSDGSGQGSSTTLLPKSLFEGAGEAQHNSPQYNAGSSRNENLRPHLSSAKIKENFNGPSFNFSSESESFSSADMFDPGQLLCPDILKKPYLAHDPQQLPAPSNLFFLGNGKSPHNETDKPLNPISITTTLQQKKPNHIRLNLSPPSSGSTLQSYSQGEPETNTNRIWSHRTPSTGRLSGASSSNRLGGSSTSGSRTSPVPFHFMPAGRSSIKEEQEKLMQMLKAEQESLSSSGSDLFNDEHMPPQTPGKMEDGDWQSILNKLQENIDILSLDGHELQILDEDNRQSVLLLRLEIPVNKRQLIESVSGKLSAMYGHFSLFHTDKSPLKFNIPLQAHKLLVKKLLGPQKGCLCETCRSKF